MSRVAFQPSVPGNHAHVADSAGTGVPFTWQTVRAACEVIDEDVPFLSKVRVLSHQRPYSVMLRIHFTLLEMYSFFLLI